MDLILNNQTIQYDAKPSVEEIIEKINELLSDQYYFSHLIVDGEEVHEDPESYLVECLESISRIEVVSKTIREFVSEVLLLAEDYLKRAIPEMTALIDGFYQSPNADNWKNFSDMLEGMQWLNQIIGLIDQAKARPNNWDECIKLAAQLDMELKNLEEAVKNADSVLIADMIQYELIPIYEALAVELKTTIDTEVKRNDTN
ncbi:hypothetical protein [Peribacillus asahii]|uniref:hypothetical protein n=1 Tax=Peribacillus asahii TaxID=228899 RepID=UPI002079517D|nr:hypothetical protein [Peribacillus asahii]USK69971.1 hypothetical protein LIS76_21050 [Peribacillus asahii]